MAEFLDLVLGEQEEEEASFEALRQNAQGINVFQVRLAKGEKSSFGFGYRALDSRSGLIITALLQDSAVEAWNQETDLNEIICVGDRIVQVNGQEDGEQMVRELKESTEVSMRLMKTGPRWHIEGVTAECMQRIEWAVGKGLKLEARAPEETDEAVERAPLHATCVQQQLMFVGCLVPNFLLLLCFSDIFYGIDVYSLFSATIWNWYGNMLAGFTTLFVLSLYVSDWTLWRHVWQKQVTAALCIYGYAFAFVLKCRFYPYAPIIILLFHVPILIATFRATLCRHVSRSSFYAAACRATMGSALIVFIVWMIWMFLGSWDGSNAYSDETKARLADESKQIYANSIVNIDGRDRSIDYLWDCPEGEQPSTDFKWINSQRVATGHALTVQETDKRDQICGEVKTIWFLVWVTPFASSMSNLVISLFCLANTWNYTQDTSGVERMLKGAIFMVCCILMMMWVAASIAAASMRLTGTLMAFCGATMVALMIWVYLELGRRMLTTTIRESKMMRMLITLATSNWVRAGLIATFHVLIPAGFALCWLNQRVRRLRGKTTSDRPLTEGAEKVLKSLEFWNWGNILVKTNIIVIVYWTLFVGVTKITYIFLSWLNVQLLDLHVAVVIVSFLIIGFTMFMLPPVPGVPVYMTSGVILAARLNPTPLGFWGGTVIAVVLSFVLKLLAVCGQYLIGYVAGKSVKVQLMVKVDSIIMKGVEKILSRKGFSTAKVCVLIGGPDWPTSVVCGILKLNLCQCLIGTTPVIFLSSPCVLAGAFSAGPNAGLPDEAESANDGIWSTFATSMLALSVVVQGGSMLAAAYFIQDTVANHSKELSKHRPDHEPVVALRAKEAEQVRCWMEVQEWHVLSTTNRVLILVSVTLNVASMVLFIYFDELCFRSFQVSGKIDDPHGKGGLAGNPFSIMHAAGWFSNGMFMAGCCLHCIFVAAMRRKSRVLYAERVLARRSKRGSSFSTMGSTISLGYRPAT